jgi:hypothetical protein
MLSVQPKNLHGMKQKYYLDRHQLAQLESWHSRTMMKWAGFFIRRNVQGLISITPLAGIAQAVRIIRSD